MFIIASNISTREPEVRELIVQWAGTGWELSRAPEQLTAMIKRCVGAEVDALEINTQQHEDHPQAVEALGDGGLLLASGRQFAAIVIGQDMTVGFTGPTEERLEFTVSESLVPFIREPRALCVLKE